MNLRWMPDGSRFVVTAAVAVDPDLRGARARPAAAAGAQASAPEVAWRLPYKEDGMGYMLQREIHLFQLDAAQRRASGSSPTGPSTCFGFDISPDGRQHRLHAHPRRPLRRTATTCGSATSTAAAHGG